MVTQSSDLYLIYDGGMAVCRPVWSGRVWVPGIWVGGIGMSTRPRLKV
jgi:hypothetical protein